MTLEAHDDDIHPRGEGDHYLENYLFTGLSDDSDFGFYLHVSRMFEVGLYELHVATYQGEDAVTCLERHDLNEGSMATDTFSYEIIEPMREWRLVYTGSGHSGAFVAGPDQPLRDLRMDIRFRAELPPADLHAAFLKAGFGGVGGEHYEQGFTWEGDITVGDTTVHERGLGLRDHSWGKRHMVVHNTTWWFPAVAPGARLFYTGLEINRAGKQMAAATRTDETSSELLDNLGVTVTAGDQVTYSRAELTWGDEPPATAQGVCRIPMPWLIGQGLPRLSDDLFCRVELPDGSRGFGVVEMSRAATEAEQAGFRATIDTRASTRRRAAVAATGLTRDLTPRIRGLAKEFPVDWSEFYTRTMPGHVQRTVLASMLVDLDEAADLDRATLGAYRDVLAGYRAPLLAAQRRDLVAQLDDVVRRDVGAAEASSLATRIMAALPMHGGSGDEVLEQLHRAAVDVDVAADRAWTAACRRHFADPVVSEAAGEGADETARVVSRIDTAVDEHFALAPGTARGRVTAGGLSKVTLTYELPDRAVVVRADRGARYSGAHVVDEYRTIAAAHAAGVIAPDPGRVRRRRGRASPGVLDRGARARQPAARHPPLPRCRPVPPTRAGAGHRPPHPGRHRHPRPRVRPADRRPRAGRPRDPRGAVARVRLRQSADRVHLPVAAGTRRGRRRTARARAR